MLLRAAVLRATTPFRSRALPRGPKRKQTSSAAKQIIETVETTTIAAAANGVNALEPSVEVQAVCPGPVTAAATAPGASPEVANGAVPPPPPLSKKKRGAAAAPKVPPGPVFDHSMRPPPLEGTGFRVLSWNVAGLRALLREEKGVDLGALAAAHDADVVCLQEVKLQEGVQCQAVQDKLRLQGWHITWNCSKEKKGYSGTAIISKQQPVSVTCGIGHEEHDGEGRVVTAEFDDFYLVNAYVPNSGEGLKRLDYRVNCWDKAFSAYLKGLCEKKGVVLSGDLNCAHQEIDIHNPKGNLRSAGFTQEERDSFSTHLLGQGFVDAFRRQYPGVVGYTYWGYRFNLRAKNAGWRLDYFLVSESMWDRVHECYHLPEVTGSDHCPLVLVLKA